MSKSPANFTSLKELINTQVRQIQPKELQNIAQITKQWPQLLGASIAQNSRVQFLRNHTLHVSVVNNTWACELNLLKSELLQKINQGCQMASPIQDIKFVVKN